MAENSNSRWALVIQNDGEASVVPLTNVSVMEPDMSADDKTSTVLVWKTNEEAESSDPVVNSSTCDDMSPLVRLNHEDKSHTCIGSPSSHITLSVNDIEDVVSELGGAVITLADASEISLREAASLDKMNTEVSCRKNKTPVTTDIVTSKDSVVHNEATEPSRIIRAHANCDSSCKGKTVCHGTYHLLPSKVHVNHRVKIKTPGADEGGGGTGTVTTGVNHSDKAAFPEEHNWQKSDYVNRIQNWKKRVPTCLEGSYEPFERVEATLHKDIVSELGIGPEEGIFLKLHQQGVAGGVRVRETEMDHLVVSGSLVELLASRDLILAEIDRIRGLTCESKIDAAADRSTREVGVMCELIPSPPMARYASSLGLDRSARRYHSVLSRPLSPEPRPQRRKSRRNILSSPKEKYTEKNKALQTFSHRYKNHVQNLSVMVPCSVKSEIDCDDPMPNSNYQGSNGNLPSGVVNKLLANIKTEPVGNTIATVNNAQSSDLNALSGCDLKLTSPSSGVKTNSKVFDITKDIDIRLSVDRQTRSKQASKGAELNNKENLNVELEEIKLKEKSNLTNSCGMDSESMNVVIERGIGVAVDNENGLAKDVKYKFSCTICSYKSMRENHFVKHMKLHEKGLALYRCGECNFVSIRASHLRRHKMTHAIQVLKCHLCTYTCDDTKLLLKHGRVKHQTSKQQHPSGKKCKSLEVYECDDCDYKTNWQYTFQRHRRTHTTTKMVSIHACTQCSYKTMRREHFLRHIKNVHQNHRPFLCDICGKAFKRQDAL
ncbi:hypothetical protein SK128_014017, partial [Halocaridina rubra]